MSGVSVSVRCAMGGVLSCVAGSPPRLEGATFRVAGRYRADPFGRPEVIHDARPHPGTRAGPDAACWPHQLDHLSDRADLMVVADLRASSSRAEMAEAVLQAAPPRFALRGIRRIQAG
jgi:hypothetical protein